MKILIINPPYATSEPPQMPIGLLYICAVLEEAGNDVRVLDMLVSKCDKESLRKTVDEFTPELVGTTSVTMNWPEASRILKWVKDIDPGIITMAGGPHATFTWKNIGREAPWIDYLVLGEGEITVLELIKAIETNGIAKNIPGLAWREGKGMAAGPKRELIKDISRLPNPARHLFPVSRYHSMWSSIGVTTGRGCPFSCIFCVGPKMVGRKPRLRTPSSVGDEIESLVKLGFKEFAFSDDHFGMKRSHALAVCEEIISRKLDINLSVFIRADTAEPVLLEKMQEAGCKNILYGAESGVQEIVNRIRKKTDLNMLKEKVDMARDMGFHIYVSFILGLPGETPETIKQTFEYAHGLGVYAGIHVLAPLPGSEVFEKAGDYGMRILSKDWSLYDANHVVTETAGLSADQLHEIVAENEANFDRLDKMEVKLWKQGKLNGWQLSNVERRRCQGFFFRLLSCGFFESEGNCVAACKHAYDDLVLNAAIQADVDIPEAGKWIKKSMEAGDIKLMTSSEHAELVFV